MSTHQVIISRDVKPLTETELGNLLQLVRTPDDLRQVVRELWTQAGWCACFVPEAGERLHAAAGLLMLLCAYSFGPTVQQSPQARSMRRAMREQLRHRSWVRQVGGL